MCTFRQGQNYRELARIATAAFSPIIIAGAFVLPPTSVGMIEQSTTRRPVRLRTCNKGSTTAASSTPHLAGSDRVINGVDSLPKDRSDLVVAVHACGKQIARPARRQRGRIHQTTRQLESGNHVLYVVGMIKKIWIDRGWLKRIGAAKRDRPSTAWPQQADVARKAVSPAQLARMVLDDCDDEMELNVGHE